MSKKVTVCLCVKDRQNIVKNTIDMLLNQDYENYEIFLCDGKSEDLTMTTLLNYQKDYPGKVVAWQTEEPGYVNTHNFVLNQAKGDYICFVDSDDIVDGGKLKEQVKFLDEHPDVDVVSSCVMFPDKRVLVNSCVELDDEVISNALQKDIPMNTICHFQSCMFRRKCLEKFTGFKYFFDEYETGRCGEGFLYTLHFLGYKFANIITTVYVYLRGVIKSGMTTKIVPEFADAIDAMTYEEKKTHILELFNKYNPPKPKIGRPKKTPKTS